MIFPLEEGEGMASPSGMVWPGMAAKPSYHGM